jgi:protein-disulfide isomerase
MTVSKRSAVKQRRADKRKRERQTTFLVIAGGVVLLIAAIVGISIYQQNQPVGDINLITPKDLPNPQGTALGDPNAPVRIDVFEDFQCPSCQVYTANIEMQVINELVATGQAYYVFRQYPFLDDRSATKESDQAANASLCAAEQDRFWDYHDMIYANMEGENAGAFTDRRLAAFAEALVLDMGAFNSCYNANKYQSQIDQDIRDALALGISGTPSVFVNGKAVSPGYVPGFEDIKAAVEAALAAGN